ncbi:MAG: hypothetical protein ACI4QX_00995 [Lachnospiraceae bacterium]
MSKPSLKLTVKNIALIGVMIAVIEVCKAALAWAPNVELTTFWIIIFSLWFGKNIYFAIPVFILIEGSIYGFGLWWLMYLYVWPLVAVVTRILRKMKSALSWAVFSGIFGLLFGLLCSVPYVFIGAMGGSIASGLGTAFAWWVAGIPWDLLHGVSNFFLMLVLYHPITSVMKNTNRLFEKGLSH